MEPTMNAKHAPTTISLRSTFSWARMALLALPLAASLGCVAADESGADDGDADDAALENDGAVLAPKRLMPTVARAAALRDQAPEGKSVAASAAVNSGHGINYHNGSVM